MVNEEAQSIALLSINPEFAYRILEGSKRVEFRKTKFATQISHVVIYATSPVKMIVGFFVVDEVIEATPHELWSQFKEIAGIDKNRFFSYFNTSRSAIGIIVREAYKLERPVCLDILEILGPPPQSFRYISSEDFNTVSNLTYIRENAIQSSTI